MMRIYKAWLVVTLVVLLSGCIFFGLLFVEEAWPYKEVLTAMLLISIGMLALCIAVIMRYASKITHEPLLAERYRVNQRDYASLYAAYSAKLLSDEFTCDGTIENPWGCEMILYTKRDFSGLDCFLFLRTDEYTQEMESCYGTLFWETLTYKNPDAPSLDVSLISLVCVNALTPTFEQRVNANVQQTPGRYHLPAGVCFGDMTVYVPCRRGGRYRFQYRRLRGALLDLI